MRLFDFSLRLNGFKIKEAQKALSQIQNEIEEDAIGYQENKRMAIFNYHMKNNSFYREFVHESNQVSQWEDIPVLRKSDLQQPLVRRLSNDYQLKNVYVNKTSGSSGHPFTFAKDKWCHALTWAMIKDRFSWYNIDFGNELQARFYGIPLDKKGYIKERLKDFLAQRHRFSIFDLSDSALSQVLHSFKKKPFVYINGYTSAVVQFAKFLERKSIILKNICPTLKQCFVTSEILIEQDRALMQKYFGVGVINEYGASELDIIAFENSDKQLQLNVETLYVEILDENNNTLPMGEEGRIVITSLFNTAHPFIRYDIGDIGVIDLGSTAGKPILKQLIGRTDDIAILPSGKKAAGLTFYYITKRIMDDAGTVKEFVIEQVEHDAFIISYASETPLNDRIKRNINEAMELYLEPNLNVTFKRFTQLARMPSGKLKQFTSRVRATS